MEDGYWMRRNKTKIGIVQTFAPVWEVTFPSPVTPQWDQSCTASEERPMLLEQGSGTWNYRQKQEAGINNVKS